MKNDDKKVNFDLSVLTLPELIKVNDEINDYIASLNDSKIEPDDKGEN